MSVPEKKYYLLTGAGGVLGSAVARALAQPENHLVLLDRQLEQLEYLDDQLQGLSVSTTLVPCELGDMEKHDPLAWEIAARFKRLDGWIACAAEFSALQPVLHLPLKQWQKELNINLTVNFRLLQVLFPLLNRAEAGRVVFACDNPQSRAQPYWGSYSLSQQMLLSLAQLFSHENATSNVKVNLFDTGPFASALRSKAFPGESQRTLPEVSRIAGKLIELLGKDISFSGEVRHFSESLPHKDSCFSASVVSKEPQTGQTAA